MSLECFLLNFHLYCTNFGKLGSFPSPWTNFYTLSSWRYLGSDRVSCSERARKHMDISRCIQVACLFLLWWWSSALFTYQEVKPLVAVIAKDCCYWCDFSSFESKTPNPSYYSFLPKQKLSQSDFSVLSSIPRLLDIWPLGKYNANKNICNMAHVT